MARKEDILGVVERPVTWIENVLGPEVEVDLSVLDECFARVDMSLQDCFRSHEAQGAYDPNVFKVAGVVCFWIRKLKPFRYVNENRGVNVKLVINELIAYLTGYHLVFGYCSTPRTRKPKLTEGYLNDVMSSLRYNSFSPHAIAFLFEAKTL
jgi:hypothetical protein